MTYEDTLRSLARQHQDLMVLTAENRAAIRTLHVDLGPRFVDYGICEQTMVGAAAGLALRGRIPVVHALATFLTMRAFEFIRTDVGIADLPVKLIGAVPGFLSEANGPTHQAIEDIALMRIIPPMRIFCPADASEMIAGMPHVIADPHPWYVRFNPLPASVDHAVPFHPGVAESLHSGLDATLLTYGVLTPHVVEAAEMLAREGRNLRVLNMRTLKPIDEEAVYAAAVETPLLVTIEDHFEVGGLHSIVAEILARRRVATRLAPMGLNNRWFVPALLPGVLRHEGFSADRLAIRIGALLSQM